MAALNFNYGLLRRRIVYESDALQKLSKRRLTELSVYVLLVDNKIHHFWSYMFGHFHSCVWFVFTQVFLLTYDINMISVIDEIL